MRKITFMVFLLGWTVSCAPFSGEVMQEVDKTLTFEEVQKNPDAYQGKTVLWGGLIIETTNRQKETILKVRETELDMEKRPTNMDRSKGRFLIRYTGFLDPLLYKEGREVTAVGEIGGAEILPVGNSQYSYPVVLAREIHLWERVPEYYPMNPPWYWDPFPYGWYRYPYWRRGPYGW